VLDESIALPAAPARRRAAHVEYVTRRPARAHWGLLVVTLLVLLLALMLQTLSTSVGPSATGADAPRVAVAAPTGGPVLMKDGDELVGVGLQERTVALTFDDGPGRSTEAILRILAEKQVRATFFDVGINENVRPATVRAIAAQGHLLGNHTWSHPDMSKMAAAAQAAEMDDASAQQEGIVGARPCFFRPPYGAYDRTTLNLAHARRMAVYNWSVDTRDWEARGSGATRWVDRIVTRAEAGGRQTHPVVLMHNSPAGNPATVAALPAIIDFYRAAGYTFVDLAGGTAPPDSRVTSATGIGQERARDIRN
jgi:peptidoglycan/xylan/chitin deacetylase (PgdA/CDA1 family)